MNDRKHLGMRSKILRQIVSCLIALGVLAIVAFFVLKPRVFLYHSKVVSNQNISGEVFESSDGIFIVRLDSGSQLTVQQTPPRVFLLTGSKMAGVCIGHFLVLPASAIGGLDLSRSEGFNRQVPVVKDGMITINDPMSQNGIISFPIEK
jgi:hypothetical protein